MSTQDQFVEDAKAQLDKWNAEIKKMQAEDEKMSADARAHLRKQIDEMEIQRDQVVEKLEEMNKANMAAWQDMQSGFQNAWKAMEKSMEEARKHYTKG